MGGTEFGLNAAAAPFKDLYDDGHLAIVQAVGMPDASRSHFDAMAYIELGTPGVLSTASGWLARHFATANNLPANIQIPILAVGSTPPTSLLGNRTTLTMNNPQYFNLGYGHWLWDGDNENRQPTVDRDMAIRDLYQGSEFIAQAGHQALAAEELISGIELC